MIHLVAALAGALGWAFVTRETPEEGERETVSERIANNLGLAAVAGVSAVAVVWIWRRGR